MVALKYRDPTTGAYLIIPGGAPGPRGPSGPAGGVFIGAIIAFGGVSAKIPSGYLPCLGQNENRLLYPELFAAIETTWGNGDGTNTFGIPNGQGRTLVGAGAGFALGTVGGSADQTLPLHSHGVRSGSGTTDWANTGHLHGTDWMAQNNVHAHTIRWRDVTVAAPHSGATNATVRQWSPNPGDQAEAVDINHYHAVGDQDRNHLHGMSVDGAGVSPTNQNLPPWAAVTYVIKF